MDLKNPNDLQSRMKWILLSFNYQFENLFTPESIELYLINQCQIGCHLRFFYFVKMQLIKQSAVNIRFGCNIPTKFIKYSTFALMLLCQLFNHSPLTFFQQEWTLKLINALKKFIFIFCSYRELPIWHSCLVTF